MKNTSAYPPLPVLVWLSLVAMLVGNLVITGTAGTDTWYDWGSAQGPAYRSDTLPQAHVPQIFQPREAQFAAVQPGRLGVTEQPGRRGVADQDSGPGADPGHVGREPMPPGGRLRPIIVEALLNRQVSAPLMLDTGATYTVLTKQTAYDLGITRLERLPKHSFLQRLRRGDEIE
jgi:hypothetical protein